MPNGDCIQSSEVTNSDRYVTLVSTQWRRELTEEEKYRKTQRLYKKAGRGGGSDLKITIY